MVARLPTPLLKMHIHQRWPNLVVNKPQATIPTLACLELAVTVDGEVTLVEMVTLVAPCLAQVIFQTDGAMVTAATNLALVMVQTGLLNLQQWVMEQRVME